MSLRAKKIKETEDRIERLYGAMYRAKDKAQELEIQASQEHGTARTIEREIQEAEELLAALKEE